MTVLAENLQTMTGVNWRREVRFYVPLVEGGYAAAGAIATATVTVVPDPTGLIVTPELPSGRGQVRIDGHAYDFGIPTTATGNDVQMVIMAATPTTLTYKGQTTTSIAIDATAAAVQAALEALPNLDVGNVAVLGDPGGPFTIMFKLPTGISLPAALPASFKGTGGDIAQLSASTAKVGTKLANLLGLAIEYPPPAVLEAQEYAMAAAASAAAAEEAVTEAVLVSQYVSGAASIKAGIEAAIAAAGARSNAVVDFEGVSYVPLATVNVTSAGVTLVNGGIRPTGQFCALQVTAADVTVRDMTFSRSTSAGYADSLSARACVTVNAARFKSIDCDYLGANGACIYLVHSHCDGTVIRGGEMTGTPATSDARGVYIAAGATGNKHITVDGVHIHDMPLAMGVFDTGYSVFKNLRLEHLRKLPTVTLTGWTIVSGNVYRQRTASGTNPGVDGPDTDRADGDTRVVKSNGSELTEVTGTSPGTNQWSISGGYVYANIGGANPSTTTMTSDIVSGYGCGIYVTGVVGVNEPLSSYNRFIDNYIEDCDGFGIYFQMGNFPGCIGNHATGNVLKDVCLEGVQFSSLPFSGFGIVGGSDTLLSGNTIDGVGSSGKLAPGMQVWPGTQNPSPRGRIVGTTVRDGFSHGFEVRSSGWTLTGCQAHNNAATGFRVFSSTTSAVVTGVSLIGCHSSNNATEGFSIVGSTGSPTTISARIIGGAAYNNTNRGIFLAAHATNQTLKDCAIIGVAVRDNGATSFHQIRVAGACARTIIDDCHLVSSTSGAIGLQVEAAAIDTIVGNNQYSLTNPEDLLVPVRVSGSRAGASWRGTGTPEAVVTAPIGVTYQRSDGGAGTTLYVKESGTGNTGWVAK